MIARRYILTGHVQGVGFRYFVYETAHRLGIAGWVRNRFDGSVEVHAESDDEPRMRKFASIISAGPPMSFVEDVQVSDEAGQNCTNFRITR